MGHAFSYLVADKRSEIIPEAENYAFRNVNREENPSGSYHGNMTICDSHPICKDYEDAVQTIRKMAEDTYYHDFAVRFYDTDKVKMSKKAESLKKRLDELRGKYYEYEQVHSIAKHQSAQIGCKNCGSKLTISYLKNERCPVCGKDLRAEYILERLNKYREDEKELSNQIRKEAHKAASKAPVRWCFKVEVHT